ncbi:outer membrane protein [Helicobacter suis]|uniref:OMP62 n=1 Tax=Helicobacter suis TaxID=104628 RepID=A0A1M4NHL5_9HELI|nr:outer membrane protein [Helicobacter suis]SFZ72312.1 OMP62 [Helicobacter suis]
MRFRFLAIPMAFSTFASLTPLCAEKSGAYMEGGFQYSTMMRGQSSTVGYQPEGGFGAPGGYSINGLSSSSYGEMYGLDTQIGYKQFFGKSKRFGIRYYVTFAYQHGTFYSGRTDLDNFNYGGGADLLYNFFEGKNGVKTAGLFAGIALEGSSWLAAGQSGFISVMNETNKLPGKHASMNTSYFQLPINLGFRTNFTKHQGLELGLRIPLVTNYYYKAVVDRGNDAGTHSVIFKRNFSVYMNYVINF